MNRYKIIKIIGYCFLIFSLGLFQVSCKKNKEFLGYKDLLDNSPMLLWGSSVEEVKSKYPDIEDFGNNDDNYILKYIPDGGKYFHFFNNQLFMVHVFGGIFAGDKLDALKNDIQKNYGIYLIEDNGTIESWYIINNENNAIAFTINKIENNKVYCSYVNPKLRDEYDKYYERSY
jgi:hypothetical protein